MTDDWLYYLSKVDQFTKRVQVQVQIQMLYGITRKVGNSNCVCAFVCEYIYPIMRVCVSVRVHSVQRGCVLRVCACIGMVCFCCCEDS